jgi:transcriptional regulator with XRE-family HTH domain
MSRVVDVSPVQDYNLGEQTEGLTVPEMTFARRLAELREAVGLSQYEVAKRAGLTRQTLSRLEMGESVPTWPTVQLLARVLGVDCTAFIDPSLQPPTSEPARPRGRPKKAESQAEGEEKPAKKTTKKRREK